MSGFVVVDASLALKWLVEEEHSDQAHAILQSWESQDMTPGGPASHAIRGGQCAPPAGGAGRIDRRGRQLTSSRACCRHESSYTRRRIFTAGRWNWQAASTRERPTTLTTWHWRRSSIANCGPLTSGSSSSRVTSPTTCIGLEDSPRRNSVRRVQDGRITLSYPQGATHRLGPGRSEGL